MPRLLAFCAAAYRFRLYSLARATSCAFEQFRQRWAFGEVLLQGFRQSAHRKRRSLISRIIAFLHSSRTRSNSAAASRSFVLISTRWQISITREESMARRALLLPYFRTAHRR